MPPRTRRAAATVADSDVDHERDSDPDYQDAGDSSSGGDSIPPSLPPSRSRQPDNKATLRPGRTPTPRKPQAQPPAQIQDHRSPLKRAAPDAGTDGRQKRQRIDAEPARHDGVAEPDATVEQGVLHSLNAFSRRNRGAKEPGHAEAPSRSRSGAESDWGPEKQLRRETEAQRSRLRETLDDLHSGGPGVYDGADHANGEVEAEQEGDVEDQGRSEQRIVPGSPVLDPSASFQTLRPAGFRRRGSSLGHIDYASPGRGSGPVVEAAKQKKNAGPRVAKIAYEDRAAKNTLSPAGRETPRPQPLAETQPRRPTVNGLSMRELDSAAPGRPGTPSEDLFVSNSEAGGLVQFELDHGFSGPPGPPDAATATAPARDPSSGPQQPTVTLESTPLQRMIRLLGGPSWTTLGPNWPTTLYRSRALDEQAFCRTKLGRSCWKTFVYLWNRFSRAPRAPDLASQGRWLEAKGPELDKACRAAEDRVDKIWQDYLAAVGDSTRQANRNVDVRRRLVKDLLEFLLPGLVGLVQAVFFLGGAEEDGEGSNEPELPEEGTFTRPVLNRMSQLLGWAARLERALTEELEQRPLDASSDNESDREEGRGSSRAKRKSKFRDGRQKKKAARRGKRLQLGKHIAELRRELAAALEEMDAAATRDERRRRAREQAERVAATQRQNEEAETEEKRRRWQAMCASTQQMRAAPSQQSQMWRRALAYQKAAAGRVVRARGDSRTHPHPTVNFVTTHTRSRPALPLDEDEEGYGEGYGEDYGEGYGEYDGYEEEYEQAWDAEPPAQSSWGPVSGRWPPWSDNQSLILLSRLRSQGPMFSVADMARAFQRDVEDVGQEVALLKHSWLSLARERGVAPEPWVLS